MKKLFGLAVAAGVLWAAGCKTTTSQTAGGAVDRAPVLGATAAAAEVPAGGVVQASAVESPRGSVVPALFAPASGGSDCSH